MLSNAVLICPQSRTATNQPLCYLHCSNRPRHMHMARTLGQVASDVRYRRATPASYRSHDMHGWSHSLANGSTARRLSSSRPMAYVPGTTDGVKAASPPPPAKEGLTVPAPPSPSPGSNTSTQTAASTAGHSGHLQAPAEGFLASGAPAVTVAGGSSVPGHGGATDMESSTSLDDEDVDEDEMCEITDWETGEASCGGAADEASQ